MIPIPEYWQAVALGINAEDTKASIFIKHNESRGIAREAILRNLVISHTPEPYRVATGFICALRQHVDMRADPEPWLSRQCDVLVYDPQIARPYYSIENLVVTSRHASKLVIEVKTTLNRESFDQIADVWDSASWVPVPTLGFAYDGVAFDTFLEYVKAAIISRPSGIPQCIAVHRKNYIALRSEYRLAPKSADRHQPAKYQLVIDFGDAQKSQGNATAVFLDAYHRWLYYPRHDTESYLPCWFNSLPLPASAKARIDDAGNVTFGESIPEE